MTAAPLTHADDTVAPSASTTASTTSELSEHGTYGTADPHTLDIGPNVRTDAALDPHFCADVREHGVEVAIDVRRRSRDGALVVRDGQRRVLAARRAQLAAVPIRIQPGDADEPATEPAAQGERIVGQLRANRHRLATPAADEAAAAQQLLELGWSPARIARATRMPARTVRAATAAGRSSFAVAALRRHADQLTLDQAAVLAEFDGDPEALKEITLTALQRPAGLDHHAQRLRDKRDIEALRASTEQSLREQGIVTVARDHDTWQGLHRLRWDADTRPGEAITKTSTASAPGTPPSSTPAGAGPTTRCSPSRGGAAATLPRTGTRRCTRTSDPAAAAAR